MKRQPQSCNTGSQFRWLLTWVALFAGMRARDVRANPQGMTVVSGTATSRSSGSQLNVTTSQLTVLNWNSFNIQSGETTTFLQPASDSVVLNNIGGTSPSQIWGHLTANGTVILENANGFYFGPNSMVKIGGSFIATTAPLRPDFGADAPWQFSGPPPLASIVNYGQLEVGAGHSLYLIAEKVENTGSLTAPGGDVGLYAGKEVLLSERPDGRGFSASVTLPAGSVDNQGRITANAGIIALQAQVVNQNGIIQADSVREQNGVIELVASDQLHLGADSQILARGDASAPASPGGTVSLLSGNQFTDTAGSLVSTAGGSQGGNGGQVEISAPNLLSLDTSLSAGARPGWKAGSLVLDPANITLANSGTGSAGNGSVAWNDGTGNLSLNVNSAFANFSTITLQATANITLAAGTTWDLSQSTGNSSGQLTLEAGNNIVFGNGALLVDQNNWSVNLHAGINFATGSVQSGGGSILLNGGNGSIRTYRGSISLTAGQDVLVGTGSITTTGDGNILVQALSGSVDAGKNNGGGNGGFNLGNESPGYDVSSALGGISTAQGGNVTIEAGQNVTSIPTVPSNQQVPGASGAYGSLPGNVTVIAGNQILGNFIVANGTGLLEAGVTVQNGTVTQTLNPAANIGNPTQPVSLSLISGNWYAFAAQNLYVSEVRNPNGIFNPDLLPVPTGVYPGNMDSSGNITAPPATQGFLFDYAPDAGASFWAGNSITLGGVKLPRNQQNQTMPAIYPPELTLEAGAGGININSTLVLDPSSKGSLNIGTFNGGSLNGTLTPDFIYMSGSGLPGGGLKTLSALEMGNAVTPLHLNDPSLVTLNISGDINNLVLELPTAANVNVGGNTYNFGLYAQNLSPSAVTSINVAGNITYRSLLTAISLPTALPSEMLDLSATTDPITVGKVLSYDPATLSLTFQGPMNSTDLTYLLNPTVYVLDSSGQPVLNGNGVAETTALTLTAAQQTAFQQLYTASQTAVVGGNGLHVSGPGLFKVTTGGNMDLGIANGISVTGPTPNLTPISLDGANLDIQVGGDLSMTTTAIQNDSLSGGINLQVGGSMDVGGQNSLLNLGVQARGIFTTGGGDVTVVANGDINVDGSRIATFDGGNVSVTSQTGDVNAGSGGLGFVPVSFPEVTSGGTLQVVNTSISGSGIMAVTPGESSAPVGNVTVVATKGSINADLGGVEQIAFNHNVPPDGFIDLQAGQNINAGGSGVIGSNIKVKAGGSISGVFVGTGGVNINAGNNFSGTIVGSSLVSVNAGGTVSGTIIGGESVSVSGESIVASLIGTTVSTTGDSSGASEGVSSAGVAQEATKVADDISATVSSAGDQDTDGELKKRKTIPLSQKVGHVTVILPKATAKQL